MLACVDLLPGTGDGFVLRLDKPPDPKNLDLELPPEFYFFGLWGCGRHVWYIHSRTDGTSAWLRAINKHLADAHCNNSWGVIA